jgi:hypothetical protein
MAPLRPGDFDGYPPQARELALRNLALLNELPPAFAAVLLREVIAYDWKFPAERGELEQQLTLLAGLSPEERQRRLSAFAAVRLSPELQHVSLAARPAEFMQRLTAWLWASGQMDAFRGAAQDYSGYLAQAAPSPRPPIRRVGIVVIGKDAAPQPGLFRKLRPHGLYLNQVKPEDGLRALLTAAETRCVSRSYKHWYIDGGRGMPVDRLTRLSYEDLQQPLDLLLKRIQKEIDSGDAGPEALRTKIAELNPEEIGLGGAGSDPVLDRFALSLLTEGSGTQIFATTFVQWAARECLRRAQPETLVLRYAPRREVQPMNVMLSSAKAATVDPQGSLVDADMGAYYTWLNMSRLSGADEMSFLAWFEGHGEAVAIGPGLPQGTTSDDRLSMKQVVGLLS